MNGQKEKNQWPSNYVLPFKFKEISDSKVSVVCPKCKKTLIIPRQVVIDFSPGGKEYHEDGKSDLICPVCEGLINIS